MKNISLTFGGGSNEVGRDWAVWTGTTKGRPNSCNYGTIGCSDPIMPAGRVSGPNVSYNGSAWPMCLEYLHKNTYNRYTPFNCAVGGTSILVDWCGSPLPNPLTNAPIDPNGYIARAKLHTLAGVFNTRFFIWAIGSADAARGTTQAEFRDATICLVNQFIAIGVHVFVGLTATTPDTDVWLATVGTPAIYEVLFKFRNNPLVHAGVNMSVLYGNGAAPTYNGAHLTHRGYELMGLEYAKVIQADGDLIDEPIVFQKQACCVHSIQKECQNVYAGEYSYRMEVKATDPGLYPHHRSEFIFDEPAGGPDAGDNLSRWYSAALFIPDDWVLDSNWVLLTQWHAPSATIPQPLQLEVNNDNLYWTRWSNAGGVEVHHYLWGSSISAYKGRWVKWSVEARWTTATDGYIRIYEDGNLIHSYSGATIYDAYTAPAWKVGLVYGASVQMNRVMYYDDMWQGYGLLTEIN